MKLILLEDVAKVGKAGELVNVSDGFGRNYLLPKKLGIIATAKSMKNLDNIKKAAEDKALRNENMLKATALEIEGTEIQFLRRADENGHLYGSVSDVDIAKELNSKGYEVHKSMIEGDHHIKEIGQYDITVKLAQEISATIKVDIQKEDE